jgi:HSP20 family protein
MHVDAGFASIPASRGTGAMGLFQCRSPVPKGVDADKIETSFKNGVLTAAMPKTPEAQKAEKKIAVEKA